MGSIDVLKQLAAKGNMFTISEVREITGFTQNTVKKLVYRLEKRGWIERLEKGKYLIIPIINYNPASRTTLPSQTRPAIHASGKGWNTMGAKRLYSEHFNSSNPIILYYLYYSYWLLGENLEFITGQKNVYIVRSNDFGLWKSRGRILCLPLK